MPNVFWAAFGGGAAAALITLVALITVEWFKWFLDRPLVKVKMSLGFLFGTTYMLTRDPSKGKDRNRLVFFEASNPHTKPVTISGFGLYYKRSKWGAFHIMPQVGYQFPYQLDGGKTLTQWSDMQDILQAIKEDGRTPRDLKWAWFRASTDKIYLSKIKKWIIKELEEEFERMNKGSTPPPS